MSGGNAGGPDVLTLHLVPVDPEAGRVDVQATLPPSLVVEAMQHGDGGPVAVVIAGALLRSLAATAATLDAGMTAAAPWIGE